MYKLVTTLYIAHRCQVRFSASNTSHELPIYLQSCTYYGLHFVCCGFSRRLAVKATPQQHKQLEIQSKYEVFNTHRNGTPARILSRSSRRFSGQTQTGKTPSATRFPSTRTTSCLLWEPRTRKILASPRYSKRHSGSGSGHLLAYGAVCFDQDREGLSLGSLFGNAVAGSHRPRIPTTLGGSTPGVRGTSVTEHQA